MVFWQRVVGGVLAESPRWLLTEMTVFVKNVISVTVPLLMTAVKTLSSKLTFLELLAKSGSFDTFGHFGHF